MTTWIRYMAYNEYRMKPKPGTQDKQGETLIVYPFVTHAYTPNTLVGDQAHWA